MNNKVSIAINALLVIAVGVLFYLHFSGRGSANEISMTSDSTAVNAKGKAVVYVNTDSLMSKYEYSLKIQDDVNVKRSTMENTIRAKQNAFQNKLNEYKNKAEYLTPTERAKVEADLGNMQADGENTSMELQGKLQSEAAALNEQLFFKVEEFLKSYAKANGHIYVLQYTRGISPILYGDSNLDVTKDVVNKLNELYKKELENPTEEPVAEEGKDKKGK